MTMNRRGFMGASLGTILGRREIAKTVTGALEGVAIPTGAGLSPTTFKADWGEAVTVDPPRWKHLTLRGLRDAGGVPDWLIDIWRRESRQMITPDSYPSVNALRSVSPVAKDMMKLEKRVAEKRAWFFDSVCKRSVYDQGEKWMQRFGIDMHRWM